MLGVLAFRSVVFSRVPKHLDSLKHYLLLLKQHAPLLLPGDPLPPSRTAFMLTFDFASIDFYTSIFPFLQLHQIPAVVGVAWRYVPPTTAMDLPLSYRLTPSGTLAFQDEVFSKHMPFCCQEELLAMASSPLIQLASSGFAVRNLQRSPSYLATEVFLSKHYLHSMLGQPPKAFLYPFGKADKNSKAYVEKHYDFSFVLGNTLNIKKTKTHGIFRFDLSPNQYSIPKLWNSPRYLKNWFLFHWGTSRFVKGKKPSL
ncbi:polysaccharide deacetylase family protein [Chlamydia pecorum]|uniref:polysaccharide deacetylase family protein n=1 Tax=Chlamydia pecorum TaxID=85991 RepID=UPI0007AF2E3E|nr:polysaccharide deacetylase family protein [Chlamydia pecorum]KZN27526.1 polysaccharide deacetylase family protein [Chlamydia pecorum]